MAVPFKSKSFKDISLSFKKHPITKDVLVLKNADAIKKSVINLVRSGVGDRPYESTIGTPVGDALFNLNTQDYESGFLESAIRITLQNYEPRIVVQKIRVTGKPPEDDAFNKIIEDTLSVRIEYTIIGQEDVPQNIQFLLT
jgi:phage baseplate assembly protein W